MQQAPRAFFTGPGGVFHRPRGHLSQVPGASFIYVLWRRVDLNSRNLGGGVYIFLFRC